MLQYDGLRLAEVVDGMPGQAMDKALASSPDPHVQHAVGIGVPHLGEVLLRMQAVYQGMAVAEGEQLVAPARSQEVIVLEPCSRPVSAQGPTFVSCKNTTDAGAARDPGGDGLLQDGAVGDAPAWAPPPLCLVPDPNAGPDPFLLPVTIHTGCDGYCAAMTNRCPDVYGDDVHCRFACEVLDWTPTGPREDSLQCRTDWATAMPANVTDAANQCSFASPLPQAQCGEPCAVYCRAGARVCPGQFPPEQVCREACIRTEIALQPANLVNYMQCRMDVLARAIFRRDLCSEAAPGNRCGTCYGLLFDF
jgi:hypothetical protein